MFVSNRPTFKFKPFVVAVCLTAGLAMAFTPAFAITKVVTDEQIPTIKTHQGIAVAQIHVSRTPPPQVNIRVNPPSATNSSLNSKNLQEARSRQEALRQERLNELQQRGISNPPKLRYRNTTPGGIRDIKRFTLEEIGR